MPHQVPPLGAVGQQEPARGAPTPNADPMALALQAAREAAARGDVPVGAVVTDAAGTVLAVSGNLMEAARDASAHAELLAMRMAVTRLEGGSEHGRLTGCDLWVTLEPCPMCAGAAGLFRIRRIFFGAYDPKGGGVEHGPRVFATAPHLHRPEIVGGVREQESADLLRQFFSRLR